MNNYKPLKQLKKFKSVCLIGHLSPDTDDFASLVCFKHFLESKFKLANVDIFAEYNKVSNSLQAIISNTKINPTPKQYDCAVMMDCPNTERLGKFKDLFVNAPYKIVIDHHATNDFCGDINIVENISSTCEIIFKIMRQFKYTPTDDEYEKLYCGILADTNGFAVGNFDEQTFKIAAECSKHVNVKKCYKQSLVNKSLANMQMLAVAILNVEQFENNKIVFTKILNNDELYGISNQLNGIEDAKIICVYSNRGSANYVSFRTKDDYDISKLAKSYGGGGHPGAAAFITDLSYTDIKTELLPKLKKILKSKQKR